MLIQPRVVAGKIFSLAVNAPAARAVRGDAPDDLVLDDGGDLLCETEVWRVEAARGRHQHRLVADLALDWFKRAG